MTASHVPPLRYQGRGRTHGEEGRYLAPPRLVSAVNTAILLERPLLVTGDPGTGKTRLANAIADELGLELLRFQVRSDHRGREILYSFDDMHRFYDAQMKDGAAARREGYLRFGVLGQAFQSEARKVVLIDEIDKAPSDFPNDLLDALDERRFFVSELDGREVAARHLPILVITSNREGRLPAPFLRRCIFHHIEFPTDAELTAILAERLPMTTAGFIAAVVRRFRDLRGVTGLQHTPATGEMLAWAHILHLSGVDVAALCADVPAGALPHLEAVLKTEGDHRRVRESTGA